MPLSRGVYTLTSLFLIALSWNAFAASMNVPVTAFSNMEHGWQLTNRGYVAFLKSNSTGRVVMAGPMSFNAVTKGKRLDAAPGARGPTLLLNIASTFVDPSIATAQGSMQGRLSICLASNTKAAPEQATCKRLTSNVPASHDDRKHQLIDVPVTYHMENGNVRIDRYNTQDVGSEGSFAAIAASVYHPIYQFLAPGFAYKDNRSPLVLDLECLNHLDLLDVWDDRHPVKFDIEGDGVANLTGWVGPSSGLLAIDRNGDGRIKDGRELFSEFSYAYALEKGAHQRFTDGFAALAQYDANHDSVIDAKDPVFPYLVVWIDRNSNGKSEKTELIPLKKLNIESINLDYRENMENGHYVRQADNEVRLISDFTFKGGKLCTIADVWFKQRRHPEIK